MLKFVACRLLLARGYGNVGNKLLSMRTAAEALSWFSREGDRLDNLHTAIKTIGRLVRYSRDLDRESQEALGKLLVRLKDHPYPHDVLFFLRSVGGFHRYDQQTLAAIREATRAVLARVEAMNLEACSIRELMILILELS
jgi:hypothetical protein